MIITRLIPMIIVVCSTITFLHAQTGDELRNSTPQERAIKQTEWMKTELSLDSVTEAKVHAINLKYAEANQSLINSSESKISKIQKVKANSAAKDDELKNVLNKNQYEKYLQRKEEMRKNGRSRVRNRN